MLTFARGWKRTRARETSWNQKYVLKFHRELWEEKHCQMGLKCKGKMFDIKDAIVGAPTSVSRLSTQMKKCFSFFVNVKRKVSNTKDHKFAGHGKWMAYTSRWGIHIYV